MDIKKDIKAVFFDIDGTYYDHVTNRVLPETIKAVEKLQKEGYKVALCSGRPYLLAKQLPVFDDIPWDGFVGGAGNRVHDEQFQSIWDNTFTNEQLTSIFSIADAHRISLFASGEYNFMTRPLSGKEHAICNLFHLEVPKEIHVWSGEKIDALSMFHDTSKEQSIFHNIDAIRLQPSCESIIDFIKTDTNKALGISQLMKYWGYEHHGYVAFGDSLNDREMLQEATYGVAMGNSMEGLLPFADIICGNSDTASIADTLKRLQLIT